MSTPFVKFFRVKGMGEKEKIGQLGSKVRKPEKEIGKSTAAKELLCFSIYENTSFRVLSCNRIVSISLSACEEQKPMCSGWKTVLKKAINMLIYVIICS